MLKLGLSLLFISSTHAAHDETTHDDDTLDIQSIIDTIYSDSTTSGFPDNNFDTTASLILCAQEGGTCGCVGTVYYMP